MSCWPRGWATRPAVRTNDFPCVVRRRRETDVRGSNPIFPLSHPRSSASRETQLHRRSSPRADRPGSLCSSLLPFSQAHSSHKHLTTTFPVLLGPSVLYPFDSYSFLSESSGGFRTRYLKREPCQTDLSDLWVLFGNLWLKSRIERLRPQSARSCLPLENGAHYDGWPPSFDLKLLVQALSILLHFGPRFHDGDTTSAKYSPRGRADRSQKR